MLQLREDDVEITGTVQQVWFDTYVPSLVPFPPDAQQWGWNVVVEPDAASAGRAVTSNGNTNVFGWILARVTPVAPYRQDPHRGRLLSGLIGRKVRIGGSWCDVLNSAGVPENTVIQPIDWMVVDRGLNPIVEEHGFTQVIHDVDVFAFSDDEERAFPGVSDVPHHRESRSVDIVINYPLRPQPDAPPVHFECVDWEHIEAQVYGFGDWPDPRFPVHNEQQLTYSHVPVGPGDGLRIQLQTGTPSAGKGFYHSKLALTYDEPFAEMCLPDVCLTDPAKSCQFTGKHRRTYMFPRLESVRAGDLLLGPAGPNGVLGRLLGALVPPQGFDHMVMFVEDDGRTVRHCTASDDRLAAERYLDGEISVSTPFGDFKKKLPLKGIRGDALRFAWPGSITQTLGEVCVTGRNRANAQFGYASMTPELTASFPATPLLRELAPEERAKRTAFHDPEAWAAAKQEPAASSRAWYSLVRLQKDPAVRADLIDLTGTTGGLLWPHLVKPHPFLEPVARTALLAAAREAKKIRAHYRFFAYSKAEIATDAAFVAPPLGSAVWTHPGADWSAGTSAAVCSSFVWAACLAANPTLSASGQPTIVLEGRVEPSDRRHLGTADGLYHYEQEERIAAGKALFKFTFDRVAGKINDAIDKAPFPADALISVVNLGGTVDDIRDALATIVANQFCNVFASDNVEDFANTWSTTGTGSAVSPDDILLRWDVNTPPTDENPPLPGRGRVNIYGNPAPVVIPSPGWGLEPIMLVREVTGTGVVHGRIVRRLEPVVGATVRLGCEATASVLPLEGRVRGSFRFDPAKAGTYLLRASMFIIDPITGVGLEWKSKDREITIHNGDNVDVGDIELLPPPGVARLVQVEHHADVVDRRTVGKDRWGHFDLPGSFVLALDPREEGLHLPPEQQNTKMADRYDQTTPEVGSGVHVRVEVNARLQEVPGPGGAPHPDGSIVADITLTFYDADEGETNATLTEANVVIAANDKHEMPYNLVSNDTVPERASGMVTVRNIIAALP